MRRKDRALPEQEAVQLLQNGEYGVLSTVDKDAQPYGVPLNFVYMDGSIYFHCALTGHKLENIAINDKVSFCVIGRTEVQPAEFSTGYESAIVFGRAAVVLGEERHQALLGLLEKYCSDFLEEGIAYIDKLDEQTNVVRVKIDKITGKAKITSNM